MKLILASSNIFLKNTVFAYSESQAKYIQKLEQRQYKNDSALMKNRLDLNLSRFLLTFFVKVERSYIVLALLVVAAFQNCVVKYFGNSCNKYIHKI